MHNPGSSLFAVKWSFVKSGGGILCRGVHVSALMRSVLRSLTPARPSCLVQWCWCEAHPKRIRRGSPGACFWNQWLVFCLPLLVLAPPCTGCHLSGRRHPLPSPPHPPSPPALLPVPPHQRQQGLQQWDDKGSCPDGQGGGQRRRGRRRTRLGREGQACEYEPAGERTGRS